MELSFFSNPTSGNNMSPTLMVKLIDMGEGNTVSRTTHFNNLDQMIKYSEELSECRRVLQLQYFGEVFDGSRWGLMKGTSCDNCERRERGDMESREITDNTKTLVTAVMRMERGQVGRFTLLQLVDVLRGGKTSPVRATVNTAPIRRF